MLSAKAISQGRGKAFNVFCQTDANNLIPPVLRILLNNLSPKTITSIIHDYDLLSCEKNAIAMIKDEDARVITLTKNANIVCPDPRTIDRQTQKVVSSNNTGDYLLGKDMVFFTKLFDNFTGPNVNITLRQNPSEIEKHTGVHTVHRLYMAAAFKVLLSGTNTGVAAIIVDPDGKILAIGKKNPAHSLLHAEASALFSYGKKLPKNVRIYSTLKPCKMCRALIEHFATDNDFLVYYGQDDSTAAALGGWTANYVELSGKGKDVFEKPIWIDKDNRVPKTVASELNDKYGKRHTQDKSQGIIDYISGGKVDTVLNKAASLLDVKTAKYKNSKLESLHNQNVQKCLTHINHVLSKW